MTRPVAPWLPPAGTTVELTAAGNSWDAVRVPARYARSILDRLGDTNGAVIEDLASQCLYWLVRPGSADGWGLSPLYASVLGGSTYVAVPPINRTKGYRLQWALPPAPTRYLTPADALHDALDTEIEAVSGPRTPPAPVALYRGDPITPTPGEAALHTLMDHTYNCTPCRVRTDGGYCPTAAELVRAEREARR
ncbi:hypothetical protein [Streptomyces sp. NBC_01506]|uniref:hypothetical protein n=1 Tax=Streptomyces sp. NBC_01506 TaxID=2903887 RepID=UPI003870D2DD